MSRRYAESCSLSPLGPAPLAGSINFSVLTQCIGLRSIFANRQAFFLKCPKGLTLAGDSHIIELAPIFGRGAKIGSGRQPFVRAMLTQ